MSELESTVGACAGRKPHEIVAAIKRSLLNHQQLEPRDDVAIMVLQVTGAARP